MSTTEEAPATDGELFGDAFADDDVSDAPWETWTGRYNRYQGLKRGRGKTVEYREFPPLPGHAKWDPAAYGQRVTTLAETLTDKYKLEQWRLRQTVLGLKENPGLLDLLGRRFNAATEHGRTLLQSVATQAMDLVGSNDAADAGTAYHSLAESFDLGHAMSGVEPDQIRWIEGYAECLEAAKLTVVPEYMERVVCSPDLGVTGRLDRIYSHPAHGLVIGDIKTQKWEPGEYDGIKLAVQFACYAFAEYILDEQSWTWKTMPQVNTERGVIIWAPSGEPGKAKPRKVDLVLGLTLARASRKTRQWRADKTIVTAW